MIFARSAIARVLRRVAALMLLSAACGAFRRRLLALVSRACCGLWQRCPARRACCGLWQHLAVVCAALLAAIFVRNSPRGVFRVCLRSLARVCEGVWIF